MRRRFPAWTAAMAIGVFGPGTGLASDSQSLLPFRNLHTSDAKPAGAVMRCYEKSPTCRRIIDEIEMSTTVLLIRHGECELGKGGSCTRFARTLPEARYLHVVLDRNLVGPSLLGVTAHELQHALEVVRAPEVIDLPSLRSLYKRIGFFQYASREREVWETEEARRIASVVCKEIRQSRKTAVAAHE
jgi:hypothetical protein